MGEGTLAPSLADVGQPGEFCSVFPAEGKVEPKLEERFGLLALDLLRRFALRLLPGRGLYRLAG